MIAPDSTLPGKRELRKHLRQRRRALSTQEQRLAAKRLAIQLQRLPFFHHARHIAAYWPADGEISPLPFLRLLQRQGKAVYLPEVLANGHLCFRRFHIGALLAGNRFGIPEPLGREQRLPPRLDIVLLPLVGFDACGHRLGMGGGYYDRTFAFRRHRHCRKPRLLGLAHHFQQVSTLGHDPWDVPLQGIVTDLAFLPARTL